MPLQTLPLPPSELGESPFWHPTEKSLYWCDIQGQAVHTWHPESGRHRQWRMPSEPGCCAPAAGGRLVIGLRNGFYLLDTAKDSADTTALTCLALLPPDQHDTAVLRLNDGRCDTAGRFWAGSVISPRTAPDAALWCLQADAASATGYSVRQMAANNFTANGLAFSPDNRTLYWSNTPEHRIDRFDFDVATGEITNRRPWVQFDRKVEGQPYGGRPDGAAVDVEGNYWVAMYEGCCVLQLSPSGEVLQRIAVPVQCPTMVCFGGEDLRTLYVTSARAGRPLEELEAEVPAGSLFSVRVTVQGLPVNFFEVFGPGEISIQNVL